MRIELISNLIEKIENTQVEAMKEENIKWENVGKKMDFKENYQGWKKNLEMYLGFRIRRQLGASV